MLEIDLLRLANSAAVSAPCSSAARALQLAALASSACRSLAAASVTAWSRFAVARSRQPWAVSRLLLKSGPGEGFNVLPSLIHLYSGLLSTADRVDGIGKGGMVIDMHLPASGSAMSLSHPALARRSGDVSQVGAHSCDSQLLFGGAPADLAGRSKSRP